MEKLVEAEAFIETAEFSGNQYGTTKQAVQQVLDSGTVLFLNDAFKLFKNLSDRYIQKRESLMRLIF
jgi:guanylate kinase